MAFLKVNLVDINFFIIHTPFFPFKYLLPPVLLSLYKQGSTHWLKFLINSHILLRTRLLNAGLCKIWGEIRKPIIEQWPVSRPMMDHRVLASLIYQPQIWALPMLWHEGWGFYNGLCQACFLSLSGLFSPKRASWLNNPLVSVLLHQWWDLPHLHRQTPHCSCTPHRAPLGQAASGSRIRILL